MILKILDKIVTILTGFVFICFFIFCNTTIDIPGMLGIPPFISIGICIGVFILMGLVFCARFALNSSLDSTRKCNGSEKSGSGPEERLWFNFSKWGILKPYRDVASWPSKGKWAVSSSPSPFFLKILKTFDAVYLMPLRLPIKFLIC